VINKTDGDIYVNIQGDEPTIRADHIDLLLQPLLNGKSDVSTLKVEVDMASAENPNCVKVVTDRHGRALYFSRFPIPFKRNENSTTRFYKHIGLYGYTRAALSSFHDLPQSPLEMAEKLEQLRFLENGIAILVVETSYDTVGVDTEADLKKAAALLLKRNPPSVDQI
jgi:3-deoxy-manno-octulosonate cytidylyltransferase (CMP-KDO synthetase)